MIIQLAGHLVTLAAPTSLAVCWDVLTTQGQNPRRALGAALGLCWRDAARPGSSKTWALKASIRPDFNVGRYGGEVIDELLAAKVPYGEIMAAGGQAIGLIVAAVPSEPEVAAERDFLPEPVGST